ncbi:MAG: TMEM165/GDT1 family protein [Ilumatobacteraceae bacterium]
MLQHVVVTYFAIAFAELPDKTMLATLMLSSRYHNRLAVWGGVTLGYAFHVIVAVSLGAVLTTLPRTPIQLLVGGLFIVGGTMTLRIHSADDSNLVSGPARLSGPRIVWLAASVILVAEFADLTQLATAGLAVRFDDPIFVAIGAILALSSISGIGVLTGSWIQRNFPLQLIQRVAGIMFLVIGGSTILVTLF